MRSCATAHTPPTRLVASSAAHFSGEVSTSPSSETAPLSQSPRGEPKVEVSFDIDANGILSVGAKDTATGKDQKITITANSGLNEAEIKKLVKEAAEHEAEDKVRREQIELRNKLDNLCYTAEKTLSEAGDKLQPNDAAQLEALVQEGKLAVEQQDSGVMTEVMGRLELEVQRIASGMHQGAGPPAEGAAPKSGGRNPTGKDVVDAEFEETQ